MPDNTTTPVNDPKAKVFGDPNTWELIAKVSHADGWMKSTKRMEVPGGWLYQVTTEFRQGAHVVACAEALAFVPTPADSNLLTESQKKAPKASKTVEG